MTVTRKKKAGCLITVLVFISIGIGFALGLIVSKATQKKKEDPAFWKEAAMNHLEKLHPSNEQRQKFAAHTDKAVGELSTLRTTAIKNVWEIVRRAVADIQQELTPEQQEIFEKIKPKEPAEIR